MGLLADLFGRKHARGAAPARSIADVEAALSRLVQERAAARDERDALSAERESALLVDGSEARIAEIEAATDKCRLTLERLDRAEPLLLSELDSLRTEAKRAHWREIRGRHESAAKDLIEAVRAALDKRAELIAIWEDATRAGFGAQVQSCFTAPSLAFSPEGLAQFEFAVERAREKILGIEVEPMAAVAPPAPKQAAAPPRQAGNGAVRIVDVNTGRDRFVRKSHAEELIAQGVARPYVGPKPEAKAPAPEPTPEDISRDS